MTRRLRTAGSKWRVLVHERGEDGSSHHIAHNRDFGYSASGGYDRCHDRLGLGAEHSQVHEFPGTEFDELVVGRAIHIEMMDVGFWWMSIAGVVIHVKADRDGRPKRVTVRMPGEWEDAVPGCEYQLHERPWPDKEREVIPDG